MSFEYFEETCNDYEKLLETEKGCDVIIYAGENENLKEIHAHSFIICARSQYFYAAFYNDWVEKENEKFIFKKPNIPSKLFEIILRFIYCGKIDLTNLQGPEILKLLMAVDELNIQSLISCIQGYLIENHYEFLQENLIDILQIFYHNELFTSLVNCCLDKIEMIFNSDKFIYLEASLLEFLLKQDNFDLNEIEIWEGLIKWGLAQEQELNQDVSKWNQDDFNIFKRILYKFIPLIRFYGISSKDYFDKVKPYEEILSKELQEEILNFHLDPEYIPTIDLFLPRYFIDSNFVNRKHFTLFASWIDGKRGKMCYKFNLLYRASRDGNMAAVFHAKCDNKGATIVVVKFTNSEQIVGGYNPLFWDSSNSVKSTNDSFIFSFSDKNNFQSAKVAYSNGCKPSIQNYSHCGPIFGVHDLYVIYSGGHIIWYHLGSYSYPTLNLPNRMDVDDFEVFQVIKK
ncbi:hypothetical protein RclHR1_21010004 [Rhizophagus clarus]|uniref:BTB domain-containing protein n=1 Tax=Rhizophagus clarus TaxID=94130 RepID=A0A2Z6RL82_9GLOM|nr:hypothetical protein RclHR1_21010004 [Rhizophagus clarus]GES81026.1 hypothetical protein GLOIN_2v1782178 [Rhizophagus clarus]